ncbi:MAG: aminopeptidase P family protein [Armatimonadetes bacterium]|nr:aminopeptidase P family protein [Armatimonadota bacterium]
MDPQRAREYMREAGLDAVIATSPENVHYASTSYIYTVLLVRDRMAFVVLPVEGPATYIVAENEMHQARLHTWVDDVQTYVEFKDYPVEALLRVIRQKGLSDGRIGIERTHLPGQCEEYLRQALPKATFVDCKSLLDRLRMVKTSEEIALLTRAATATRKALESAFAAARPGDTEKQVANHIGRNLLDMGADFIPFLSVKTGVRLSLGHHLPGDTRLEPGNLIWCDYGGLWHGYFSDLARTYAIGEPTKAQAANYRQLSRVYREVVDHIRVGTPIKRLYEICKHGFEASGVTLHMAHIGHSIGVELHEFPMISPFDTYEVQENMVLNVEPGYTKDGETIHIEDLILATKTGPQVLTGTLAPAEIPVIQ